jgi:spermidine dehydrogenase
MARHSGLDWGSTGTELMSIAAARSCGALGFAPVAVFDEDNPYIHHFPDGNAGFARSIVRDLIPSAIPGTTMEDLVKARVDYDGLDLASSMVRIRLNSTAVKVKHTPSEKAVDVTYIKHGKPYRVRAEHVIMACYNNIIPHICPEMPEAQKEAIAYATKMPLVYISIAVRNWKAFSNLGYRSFYVPQPSLMHSFGLDFPVSMGGYNFTQNPDEPTVIHGTYVPLDPDKGLNARQQSIAGRTRLYEMSFDDFEENIVSQMSGALHGGGFDADLQVVVPVHHGVHGVVDHGPEDHGEEDPPAARVTEPVWAAKAMGTAQPKAAPR